MTNIIQIIALSVLAGVAAGYGEQNDEQYSEQDLGSDLYGNSKDAPKYRDWDPDEAVARVKRYESKRRRDNELKNVKGALKEILSGRNIEELFMFQSKDTTRTHTASRSHKLIDRMRGYSETNDDIFNLQIDEYVTQTATRSKYPQETEFLEEIGKTEKAEASKKEYGSDIAVQLNKTPDKETARPVKETRIFLLRQGDRQLVRDQTTTGAVLNSTLPLCYTTTSTTTTAPSTVLTTTTPPPKFDIPALMDIISNFTYDWLQNLTRQVNETLQKKGIPTCPGSTTTDTPSTTEYLVLPNMTGTTIAKCYVCGLDRPLIPRDSSCGDAFAGDFLPLMPINPNSRSKIASFKKYCTYNEIPYKRPDPILGQGDWEILSGVSNSKASTMDVSDVKVDQDGQNIRTQKDQMNDPKRLHGPWTGGCAVRWVDLTGVYTQRTCRNRYKPMMGWHVVSKRMAMLEMALRNVDNGCIISPAASLVPMSRGISLYARVHTCVCTGNWCNRASVNPPWTAYIAIVTINVIAKEIVWIF